MWRWVALWLLLPNTAWAQCTLAEVADIEDADVTIYFTKFPGEDESQGRFADCILIDIQKADESTQTFWISPFRQDADWVVHPSNFPN
ncbi:MAG: hypothetical protein AAGD10_06195 [Myxococcota bacterium]